MNNTFFRRRRTSSMKQAEAMQCRIIFSRTQSFLKTKSGMGSACLPSFVARLSPVRSSQAATQPSFLARQSMIRFLRRSMMIAAASAAAENSSTASIWFALISATPTHAPPGSARLRAVLPAVASAWAVPAMSSGTSVPPRILVHFTIRFIIFSLPPDRLRPVHEKIARRNRCRSAVPCL